MLLRLKLPQQTTTSKAETAKLSCDIEAVKSQMETLSARDHFAEYAKLQRQLNKLEAAKATMDCGKQSGVAKDPILQQKILFFLGDSVFQYCAIYLIATFCFGKSAIIELPVSFASPLHKLPPFSFITERDGETLRIRVFWSWVMVLASVSSCKRTTKLFGELRSKLRS